MAKLNHSSSSETKPHHYLDPGDCAVLKGRVTASGDAGYDEARVCEAYPVPTLDRLRAIKRRYDPTDLFRLNQNIPPAI